MEHTQTQVYVLFVLLVLISFSSSLPSVFLPLLAFFVQLKVFPSHSFPFLHSIPCSSLPITSLFLTPHLTSHLSLPHITSRSHIPSITPFPLPSFPSSLLPTFISFSSHPPTLLLPSSTSFPSSFLPTLTSFPSLPASASPHLRFFSFSISLEPSRPRHAPCLPITCLRMSINTGTSTHRHTQTQV